MMKHLIWFSIVLALLSGVPTTPALAEYPARPSTIRASFLANLATGRLSNGQLMHDRDVLCLRSKSENPISGDAVVQRPCKESDVWQQWLFKPVPPFVDDEVHSEQPGIYWIVNTQTRQCLDNKDGRGHDVQLWPCNQTSTTMQWKVEAVDKEPQIWGRFVNMRSKKCLSLGVRLGETEPSRPPPPRTTPPVVQYACARSSGRVRHVFISVGGGDRSVSVEVKMDGRPNLSQTFLWWVPR
jgi:hypothetical protein